MISAARNGPASGGAGRTVPVRGRSVICARRSPRAAELAASGYAAASEVPLTDVTAIATYHDLVALGALARLREMGIVVPEAMSVVGFDDISLDHVAHSQLTTVSVARDEVGRRGRRCSSST